MPIFFVDLETPTMPTYVDPTTGECRVPRNLKDRTRLIHTEDAEKAKEFAKRLKEMDVDVARELIRKIEEALATFHNYNTIEDFDFVALAMAKKNTTNDPDQQNLYEEVIDAFKTRPRRDAIIRYMKFEYERDLPGSIASDDEDDMESGKRAPAWTHQGGEPATKRKNERRFEHIAFALGQ